MPPGRQEIETYSVNSDYRNRINQFMLKEVEAGRQCYVVCPKVEESEEDELADVVSYSRELSDALPSKIIVEYFDHLGLVHRNTLVRKISNKRMPSQNSPSNIKGRLSSTMLKEYIVIMNK